MTLEDVLSNTDGQVIAVYRQGQQMVLDQREAILLRRSPRSDHPILRVCAGPGGTESFGHGGGLAFTSHRLAADPVCNGPCTLTITCEDSEVISHIRNLQQRGVLTPRAAS